MTGPDLCGHTVVNMDDNNDMSSQVNMDDNNDMSSQVNMDDNNNMPSQVNMDDNNNMSSHYAYTAQREKKSNGNIQEKIWIWWIRLADQRNVFTIGLNQTQFIHIL